MIYKLPDNMETYDMKNIDGFKAKKIDHWGLTPCDVIFNHIEKPNDYIYCKSVNVFEDRWRVNIYSKRYVEGIEGKYISKSYFVNFDKNNGEIAFVSPKI